MTPSTADLFETAKALPVQERAELAQELLTTLGEHDLPDTARLDVLCTAVDAGITALDTGQGITIPPDDLRDYLRERGRQATERANAKTA